MSFLPRPILAGGLLAALLCAPGTTVLAEQTPASRLVQFEARTYRVELGDGVSERAISVRDVRKLAFGRPSRVSIVTTASGTYSSEAMLSPHVRYRGVRVVGAPAR